MKIILNFSILMGVSFFAINQLHASFNFDAAELSPYEQIKEWESISGPVLFKNFEGVFNGICFNANEPSTPIKIAVAITGLQDSVDRGPGFPPKTEKKVALINVGAYVSADSRYNHVLSYTKSNWSQFEVLLQNESTLKYRQGYLKGEIFKYEDYLVTVAKTTTAISCPADWPERICGDGQLPKDSEFTACYFYEEITE